MAHPGNPSMRTLVASVLLIPPCDVGREPPPTDSGWTETGWSYGDTGVAVSYWTGSFAADGSAFVSGTFGWSYLGLATNSWVCDLTGDFVYDGEPAYGCPGCTWAWDLSAVRDSRAEGDCHNGDLFVSDGDLDGGFDYAWGFTETYYYDYGGHPLTFEDVVMVYADGWFAFAFSLPAYGIYQTSVSGEEVTFSRLITGPNGRPYYYYYAR
jgi:hypothetical protein